MLCSSVTLVVSALRDHLSKLELRLKHRAVQSLPTREIGSCAGIEKRGSDRFCENRKYQQNRSKLVQNSISEI
jgi:hypothetical protein